MAGSTVRHRMGRIRAPGRPDFSKGMVIMTTATETLNRAATYDLRANPAWTVSLGMLADEFVMEGNKYCAEFLRDYFAWSPKWARGIVNIETMLEALTFGVLWDLYAEEYPHQKAEDRMEMHETERTVIPEGRALAAVNHFISLLQLMGEFDEEARRIERFAKFFAARSDTEIRHYLDAMTRFARWFRRRGQELLGDITGHVEEFRMHAALGDEYRDDAALRNRHEVEYHLNLLAAIILNCAWHDRYTAEKKKLLVLPDCMRPDNGKTCHALKTGLGLVCMGCTKECAVNQAQCCAARFDIPTVVVEHQSAVFAEEHVQTNRKEGYAVIGVACALSLQAGGWKAQDAGIPAQCLPLNCPGCTRHWTEGEHQATEINLGLLMELMEGANFSPQW
ncbi:MAG: DUF116 domain-containing protein [Chitinivibrionales bacterium]|nr:DUF116 domain-containing protein [Chitinivibrionales bacterium]